jgi:hypothetical protein
LIKKENQRDKKGWKRREEKQMFEMIPKAVADKMALF